MKKRLIVIGGGPGGYVSAIRAAQFGAEVHLVEKDILGGTCLNKGCIPTKALLHTANYYHALKMGKIPGLIAENILVDWQVLQDRKVAIVNNLRKGVEGLLKLNGVVVHKGQASISDVKQVKIEGIGNPYYLSADDIIISSGSEPIKLYFPGSESERVIDSSTALCLDRIPTSLVIVGGGVIGLEFAFLYNSLGCKVIVIETLPEILPSVDDEIAAIIKKEMISQGVIFYNNSKISRVCPNPTGLTCKVTSGNVEKEIYAEYVLVAVGRKPQANNLDLDKFGVLSKDGKVLVNSQLMTRQPGIYAIGDCNGKSMLAHAASAQGIAVVEHLMGREATNYLNTIPYCVYTSPELAGVGLTEKQVKEKSIDYTIGRFSLIANSKSIIEGEVRGIIKIIAQAKNGEILGVHMVGPKVTEIISEVVLAMNLEATVDDLRTNIHPHPTVSEAVFEAALDVGGQAIHYRNVK